MMNNQPSWDAIPHAETIPLMDWRKMSTEFGYLLRHYWMPDTRLTLKRTIVQHLSHAPKLTVEQTLGRTMLQCDADQCVWREEVLESNGPEKQRIHFSGPHAKKEIHYYNRSKQTYQVRSLPGTTRWPEEEQDARHQAFLRQPVLNPLLPIPVGFEWHVRNEEGYLDFRLESVTTDRDMTILTIRRHGEFSLNEFYIENTPYVHRCKIVREGITLYALNRAIVLEDRTYDRLESDSSEIDGMETWTTLKLMKSELLENGTSLTIRDSILDSLRGIK